MTTFGSVCSGIEAASVAWHPLGWSASWLAEIEAFPSAVLAHHYPSVPNLGDMTLIAESVANDNVPAPDVLVGGTPCQAFSVAGARKGLADDRGFLTIKYVELANAIDKKRVSTGAAPAVIVWENVPGVLSSKDNAFGAFLGLLSGEECELQPPGGKWKNAGYVHGPQRTIAWRILDAQYFGVAQRRRRVFVVASARDGFDPSKILFEFDGVRRDTAPCREARQIVASITANGVGTCRADDNQAQAGHLQPVTFDRQSTGEYGTAPVASTVSARDYKGATDLILNMAPEAIGFHHNAQTCQLPTETRDTSISDTLTGSQQAAAAYSVALRGRDGGATAEMGDNLSGCLRASSGGGDKPHVLAAMAVRRLTPVECERLQGFPDGYTLVPHRNKPAADGPRYKSLGNSMAVPCMHWIGSRIDAALRASTAGNDNKPTAAVAV